MGAQVEEKEDEFVVTAPNGMKGALIELEYPSVGATETILFAAVMAQGRTVIKNAAIEPEIISLLMMLQKMGAIIGRGVGRQIEIVGVKKMTGCTHRVIADRLEAASFACLALATRGEIFCEGAGHSAMITFLNSVRLIGGEYEVTPDGVWFRGSDSYKGIQLETDTHPGFATDWQQPFVVVLTQAEGTSVIHETVYEERFGYTDTLKAMGADIRATHALSDHQPLSDALMTRMLREARAMGAQVVTTEKDAVRLPPALRAQVMTVPVRLRIADWGPLDAGLDRVTG